MTRTAGDPEIDGPAKALNPRVVYIPGEYCVHRGGELIAAARRQLRLSYGFEELPAIERALTEMGQAAQHVDGKR